MICTQWCSVKGPMRSFFVIFLFEDFDEVFKYFLHFKMPLPPLCMQPINGI